MTTRLTDMIRNTVGMVSPGGCTRQTWLPPTSAVGNSERAGIEWRIRTNMTIETIRSRPHHGISLVRRQFRTDIGKSQAFVPRRSFVVSQASNSKVATSKQGAKKGSDGKEPARSRVIPNKEQNQKQAGVKFTPPSSSEATTPTRQVLKGGFAGLAALKAELEQERPRISRVNVNDAGNRVLPQQKQAELQRGQIRFQSKTSPKSGVNRETSPSGLTSEVQARKGDQPLILVRNLAKQVTEEEYQTVMQSIPKIISWRYLSDKEGLCLGYGFCEVQAEADAAVVIQILSEKVLHGKKIEASLAAKSREYKLPAERQVGQTVASTVQGRKAPIATSSRSVKDRVEKGSNNVRNQAVLRDVSKVPPSAVERASMDSSQGNDSTDDGNLKAKLEHGSQYAKGEPMYASKTAPSSLERAATETGSSTASKDSPQGQESADDGKLSGKSVMEAIQRAAALRDSKTKPRRRKGGLRSKPRSDNDTTADEEEEQEDHFPPFVFKSDWASRIKELQNDVKNLRRLI